MTASKADLGHCPFNASTGRNFFLLVAVDWCLTGIFSNKKITVKFTVKYIQSNAK